jgi:uncharacterized protein YqcC (DUF446 family)
MIAISKDSGNRLDYWTQFQAEAENFLYTNTFILTLAPTESLIQWVLEFFFPRSKVAGMKLSTLFHSG